MALTVYNPAKINGEIGHLPVGQNDPEPNPSILTQVRSSLK